MLPDYVVSSRSHQQKLVVNDSPALHDRPYRIGSSDFPNFNSMMNLTSNLFECTMWETSEDDTEPSSADDDSDDDELESLYTSLEAQLKRLLQLPWLAQRQKPPLSAEVLEGASEQLHVFAAEIHGLRMAANAIPDMRGVTALRAAADMLEDRLEQVTGLCVQHQQQWQQEEREGSQAHQRQAHTLVGSSLAAVFNDKQLVELVLGFVGPGYWLYVAGVSRLMRGRYMAAVVHDWPELYVAPPLFKTSMSNAAVQSASALSMAAKSSGTYKLLQTRALMSHCDESDSIVGRIWALFGAYAVENVNHWQALLLWLVQQAKRNSWPEWRREVTGLVPNFNFNYYQKVQPRACNSEQARAMQAVWQQRQQQRAAGNLKSMELLRGPIPSAITLLRYFQKFANRHLGCCVAEAQFTQDMALHRPGTAAIYIAETCQMLAVCNH
ncbi:hypothetical protein JKP88DRAFT_263851 [Tribonema minus]|uniref:Uncharacterized protein n=1 Tax=Tribonema minus TaxID=303371 RepID=A0A835Z0D2_9STRA|nr:hypothetical protein JKP88DRAFT_263851 [Tribonema minus]